MIVRESLDPMDFKRTGDVYRSMKIGKEISIQNWLKEQGIEDYTIEEVNKDLIINSDSNIIFQNYNLEADSKGIIEFPSFIQFGTTKTFDCGNATLISLRGCPREVKGNFWCNHNELKTLEGGPIYVTGNYNCSSNFLESFIGAPRQVLGNFVAPNNPITSLKGLSHTIEGSFRYSGDPKVFTLDNFLDVGSNIYGTINWEDETLVPSMEKRQ